jgi:hypothetical protein
MPKLDPEATLLSPSTRLLGAGDGVQNCPDTNAITASFANRLDDSPINWVEPGRGPWLGQRQVDLLGVFGCHDYGNHLEIPTRVLRFAPMPEDC